MLRVILLAIALTLSSAPVAAGTWDDALAAYERGDYDTAERFFRPLAEQGNAGAQLTIGLMYGEGRGVPQDYVEAMKWYRKAAEQGYAMAQSILGLMYSNGDGVWQDYAEAARWHRKAAEQGFAWAQYNLGLMYSNGHGVPQDLALAHMWIAALAGDEQGEVTGLGLHQTGEAAQDGGAFMRGQPGVAVGMGGGGGAQLRIDRLPALKLQGFDQGAVEGLCDIESVLI